MRKRTVWLLVSMMVLMAGGFTLLAGGGATVINDFGCGLLDGKGGAAVADSSHAVVTPSGNATITCQATVAPPVDGTAVQWNFANTGMLCGTLAGTTDDWQETVSADGQASMTCHVNGS